VTQPTRQTVYVIEVDCYEQRHVAGVFATPEAAMHGVDGYWQHDPGRTDDDGFVWPDRWSNGLDWGAAASITAHVVADLGGSE